MSLLKKCARSLVETKLFASNAANVRSKHTLRPGLARSKRSQKSSKPTRDLDLQGSHEQVRLFPPQHLPERILGSGARTGCTYQLPVRFCANRPAAPFPHRCNPGRRKARQVAELFVRSGESSQCPKASIRRMRTPSRGLPSHAMSPAHVSP
jgi:hypothetical protein